MPKLSIYLDDDAHEALTSVGKIGEKPSQTIARLLLEAEARELLKQFSPK